MNIWNLPSLLLFIIFFVPGFISMKVYDLFIPGERRNFSEDIYQAIGFSCINFAILSWLIILIHSGGFPRSHQIWYSIFLFIILFASPAVLPVIFLKFLSCEKIAKYIRNPIDKAWDWVFRNKRNAQWVIIHLRDRRLIGGKFGKESFASSSPAEEQIFIEQVWKIDKDGNFLKPIERSKGMLVLGSEILALEFFN